ncbi:glycoside hydrolase family 5 protein [Rariglobus hedericola]|uniref:Glycoside hydrolase family 5 protein n=1 Tax=Rariglobus hedericola TaxID=2597822 RepID=A0A556QSD8_9BACT|nr:cellulase family glycosylhydrolase [Rariglobus hedericola]TSJ79556.1 glycoside hydrolase family 5 protein [Rariglobus hedericola]
MNPLRRFLLLALVACVSGAAAQAADEPPKPDTKPRNYPKDPEAEAARPEKWPSELKVSGNRLVNTDGNEVWLQGLAIPGLEIRPEGHGAVHSTIVGIDEWKANVIRLAVKDEYWFGRSKSQTDGGAAYRALVDSAVNAAANRGAYIVLDNHRYRAVRDEHLVFWTEVALKYKNHPAVLFEIINEPHGISWDLWRDGGFVSEKKKGVDESAFLSDAEKKQNQGFESPGMQRAVNLIRTTGARNIIIAAGLGWSFNLSGITKGYELNDPSGNGIMYSWHVYNWHKGWEENVLATAAKHPIFVGEVGADVNKMDFLPSEIQENPYTWVPDILGFIQKHRLNWTGWSFHAWATPVLISDWNYTPTPAWGVPAKAALSGEQFELKKMR